MFHYSCGDFVECTADKDVGGYKGNIFLGVYNKQVMKLGQRESVCSGDCSGSIGPRPDGFSSQPCLIW